jgi:hypothetical protein
VTLSLKYFLNIYFFYPSTWGRVQQILQDGGLYTGDIVVIVVYFLGERNMNFVSVF